MSYLAMKEEQQPIPKWVYKEPVYEITPWYDEICVRKECWQLVKDSDKYIDERTVIAIMKRKS